MAYFGNSNKNNFKPRRKRRTLGKVKNPLSSDSGRNILFGILVFVLFSIFLFLMFKILASDIFRLDRITPYGERTATKEQLQESLSVFDNRLIFFVDEKEIQEVLTDTYPGMKVVRAQKFWPNEMSLIITETEPLLYYVNLGGLYIVNENGTVTDIVYQEDINFNEEQVNIITGAEGINSKLVRERLASEHEEENADNEDAERFRFSSIPDEKKFETLSTIRNELVDQSLAIMNTYTESHVDNSSHDLETVYSFDNSPLEIGSEVDKNKLQLTREVVKFSSQVDQELLTEIFWEGKFLVKVTTESGKLITFGTNRPISEQLEDLLIVTQELEVNDESYSEVDLTSKKISVK